MLYKPYFQEEDPSPDELTHHGVLGMKWGVRRYQNKDGTLTSAGQNVPNGLKVLEKRVLIMPIN